MPVLLARLGVSAVLLFTFLPVSLERRFLPKISCARASCSLLCLSVKHALSVVGACGATRRAYGIPRVMISSKLMAGFAALMMAVVAQVTMPAAGDNGVCGE